MVFVWLVVCVYGGAGLPYVAALMLSGSVRLQLLSGTLDSRCALSCLVLFSKSSSLEQILRHLRAWL